MASNGKVRSQWHVTYEAAAEVIVTGLARAAELGVQVGISVVDGNGFLVAFARMDGAAARVEEGASGKARFAAALGQSTGQFIEQRLKHDEVLWRAMGRSPDVFIVPGGSPLLDGDRPVGGVGVSGARHQQDAEIAQAAADHFAGASSRPGGSR